MSRNPTDGIDYTNRDYEAYKEMMIEKLQEKMPEYTDTRETDAGIVILECLANGLDILSMYNDIIANDCFLPTTQDRRIAVQIARQLQYIPKNQTPSVVEIVFQLTSAQDSPIVIPKGTSVSTIESDDYEQVFFETTEDLTIPAGFIGTEKNGYEYLYKVNAVQGITIEDDIVGTSNNASYQEFRLGSLEVLLDTLEVWVDEGDGAELWEQVDTFINSDDTDKHYIATVDEYDNCYIQFGNGSRGKIPISIDNGITANYRVGGGTIGNVSKETIVEVNDEIAYVDYCFNPEEPFILGEDKESLEEIKEKAPSQFRTQDRAITLRDYSDLLKNNFRQINDVIAVQDEEQLLKVNIYVLMNEGYTLDFITSALSEFLDDRIIPGTTYSFDNPHLCNVNLDEINVHTLYGYESNVVKQKVEDYIRNEVFTPDSFVFGSNIYISDLEIALINDIEGVGTARINSREISGEDVETQETYDYTEMVRRDSIIQAPEDYQILNINDITVNMI